MTDREQLTVILYRQDGQWRAGLDAGRRGIAHARAVGEQDFEISDTDAERLIATVSGTLSPQAPETDLRTVVAADLRDGVTGLDRVSVALQVIRFYLEQTAEDA